MFNEKELEWLFAVTFVLLEVLALWIRVVCFFSSFLSWYFSSAGFENKCIQFLKVTDQRWRNEMFNIQHSFMKRACD